MAIRQHVRQMIIGQSDDGWWAVNPEPAFKHRDLNRLEVIVQGIPDREKLMNFLSDLGYRQENIFEGILNKP